MGFLFYTLVRVPASFGCSSVVETCVLVRLSMSSLMPNAVRPFFWSSLASKRSPHPQCSWKALEHCLMSSRTHKGLALNVTCALFNLLTRDREQSLHRSLDLNLKIAAHRATPRRLACRHHLTRVAVSTLAALWTLTAAAALPCRHPLQGSYSDETVGHNRAEHPKLFASDLPDCPGPRKPSCPKLRAGSSDFLLPWKLLPPSSDCSPAGAAGPQGTQLSSSAFADPVPQRAPGCLFCGSH